MMIMTVPVNLCLFILFQYPVSHISCHLIKERLVTLELSTIQLSMYSAIPNKVPMSSYMTFLPFATVKLQTLFIYHMKEYTVHLGIEALQSCFNNMTRDKCLRITCPWVLIKTVTLNHCPALPCYTNISQSLTVSKIYLCLYIAV